MFVFLVPLSSISIFSRVRLSPLLSRQESRNLSLVHPAMVRKIEEVIPCGTTPVVAAGCCLLPDVVGANRVTSIGRRSVSARSVRSFGWRCQRHAYFVVTLFLHPGYGMCKCRNGSPRCPTSSRVSVQTKQPASRSASRYYRESGLGVEKLITLSPKMDRPSGS
uniref:Putative secreted protein n=1 Tax=Anopheles darlingi TaxID=43151 RepID=A0A2M4D3D8_ANODA